jgi:competence protein ComEC
VSRSRQLLLVFCCSLALLAVCVGASQTDGPTTDTATPATAEWNSTLEVHYINVGQSVSTLVVGPTGETMLVERNELDTLQWSQPAVLCSLGRCGESRL